MRHHGVFRHEAQILHLLRVASSCKGLLIAFARQVGQFHNEFQVEVVELRGLFQSGKQVLPARKRALRPALKKAVAGLNHFFT